ncbi:hypothetical protein BYT27DRAFT_7112049 [Phlegmacium glaucopus]|nr:hypothetical protein BYT27DRAFT_7112049 [Phlegmacium glaucopus]
MGSPSKNDDLRSLTKHDTYYIAGGDLCFLVENMCFRVHRYFFERESTYFIGKLAMPASPGQQPQGTQDGNAILLEHVTVEEFARFLWVFYNPRYSLYDATVSDWEIVLKLSVRWGFPEVKNLAVRELEKKEIPDAKRIKLYHANDVDKNILIPRYASLCEREASITLEEGRDLGMETVLMIALGREQARSSRLATGARSPLSPTIHGDELHNVVREIFQIPEPSSNPDKDNTGGLVTNHYYENFLILITLLLFIFASSQRLRRHQRSRPR